MLACPILPDWLASSQDPVILHPRAACRHTLQLPDPLTCCSTSNRSSCSLSLTGTGSRSDMCHPEAACLCCLALPCLPGWRRWLPAPVPSTTSACTADRQLLTPFNWLSSLQACLLPYSPASLAVVPVAGSPVHLDGNALRLESPCAPRGCRQLLAGTALPAWVG